MDPHINSSALFFYSLKPKDIQSAIHYTERALTKLGELCGGITLKHTKDDECEEDLGRVCGNLAYFYTELKIGRKYPKALQYATIALEVGEKNRDINFIDNYLFAVKEAALALNDKVQWVKIYKNYRDFLVKGKILTSKELSSYDDNLKKWETEIEQK